MNKEGNIASFWLKFQEASSLNLSATQAIKTEDVHCLPESLKANTSTIPQIRHDHFLPNSLQTIIHYGHMLVESTAVQQHRVLHMYTLIHSVVKWKTYMLKSRCNFSTSMPSKYIGRAEAQLCSFLTSGLDTDEWVNIAAFISMH